MSIIAGTAIESALGVYKIERSLRFNSADTTNLQWTPSVSPTSRTKTTLSFWVKRSAISSGTYQNIYSVAVSSGFYSNSGFETTDQFTFGINTSNYLYTTQLFRDPSAWYHFVCVVDTTQATSSDRLKVYVNGSRITSFSSSNYPSLNSTDNYLLYTYNQIIGGVKTSGTGGSVLQVFNGYMAEFYGIDGQALDPTSFGEYNVDTGVWQPIAYTGSYGTNGFYLDFADNSSTTALGYDAAGSNDWTPNNFSVTAGAGNDSLVDTPTPYGTDTGVGGEVRGNYATFNAIAKTSNVTLTNGSLDAAFGTVSGGGGVIATIAPSSGKWYWEVTVTAVSSGAIHIGVLSSVLTTFSGTQYYEPGLTADGYAYQNDGTKYNNNTNTSYGASYTTNDVIGVAMDLDAGTLTFYKNGSSQGQAFSGLSGAYFPAVGDGSSAGTHSVTANFGQRPFAYAAPSGFKSLCTTNLPDPAIADGSTAMNVVLYTGDGTANRSVTGVGFQPDLVWAKSRSATYYHGLFDNLRSGRALYSNSTDVEDTTEVVAFNSDGFTTPNKTGDFINTNSATYVAWNWKAGGAGVSVSAGDAAYGSPSLASTLSANTTAGFSISTYTGNDTSGATVAHGLGVQPAMVICKNRTTGIGSGAWPVWHKSLSGGNYYLFLNTTAAQANGNNNFTSAPTNYLVNLGRSDTNNTADMVMYAFAPIAGYSAFGNYTGNGSTDGPFVYLGFRPAYVLIKCSSNTNTEWEIRDDQRLTYNPETELLFANSSSATYATNPYYKCDLLSNGFKLRNTNSASNASGYTYIYAAFAENPFKYALAR